MTQPKQTSGKVFFKFGVGFCLVVFLLVTVNMFVRSTEGRGINPWENFQESSGTSEEGLKIMQRYGCFLCHRIDDFGGEIGPKLNAVKDRKTRQELFAWIKSPKSIKPNTIMPEFHLSDDEILRIISYLETK
ncbi:MAG: cytochrome c [Bacteroidota bacterium]|nr:cytochrome c [Bacteroidota bacterium]MDP4229884.1 cytochrome c [Bacteroidota bacterium]MDP4237217.1 cytochrome c [Bacteroidota bacterium]